MKEQPGEFPYTRGIYRDMYQTRLWTMRQYAGFGTAEESNRRYRYLLSEGTNGLSVAFDLPTQMGLDPTTPLPRARWGAWGCQSVRWTTWKRCLTESAWSRSALR